MTNHDNIYDTSPFNISYDLIDPDDMESGYVLNTTFVDGSTVANPLGYDYEGLGGATADFGTDFDAVNFDTADVFFITNTGTGSPDFADIDNSDYEGIVYDSGADTVQYYRSESDIYNIDYLTDEDELFANNTALVAQFKTAHQGGWSGAGMQLFFSDDDNEDRQTIVKNLVPGSSIVASEGVGNVAIVYVSSPDNSAFSSVGVLRGSPTGGALTLANVSAGFTSSILDSATVAAGVAVIAQKFDGLSAAQLVDLVQQTSTADLGDYKKFDLSKALSPVGNLQ